jgi:ATP-dependent Lon protease
MGEKTINLAIEIPETLPVLVLQDAPLFPGALIALQVDEDDAAVARERLTTDTPLVAVVAARKDDGQPAEPAQAPAGGQADGAADADDEVLVELHDIGVAARIAKVSDTEDGHATVVLQGLQRVRLGEIRERKPQLVASVEAIEEMKAASTPELEALALEAKRLAREILSMLPGVPAEIANAVQQIADPALLADTLAYRVPAPVAEKQKALETLHVGQRLQHVIGMLARRRDALEVSSAIDSAVQSSIGKAEKEHLLRRRMAAIQKELGEVEEDNGKGTLEEKLKDLALPEDVRKQVDRELSRLGRIPQQSPETNVVRSWLQLVADLPWSARTLDDLDLDHAQAMLDADHHGLEKVKKRIISYLAVRRLKNDLRGPILCLIGPPGVGKTSLGQSIAKAMGRKLVRLSLGGVRDEAEIRGHRRTYVGAMPGRIIQAMKRAGTQNPIIVLDEIEKLGHDAMHGDPAAALLEVLDSEQNHAFSDHYLEVPFDLSQVLFIATGNGLDGIPAPLRDRMEVIELPGYTLDEKLAIARRHLVGKQLDAHGLTPSQAHFDDAALERIVQGHTREAGVRALEKRIADLCRALAVEKASGALPDGVDRAITADEVERILGPDKFERDLDERVSIPGIASGLAWTPAGGDVLFVEATAMPGKGNFIVSGQLGGVMKESAQAAWSWVKSNAARIGIASEAIEGHDLHVHVPAGAQPKDGPSAGVTLVAAITSLFTGIKVRADVAMTGELTLRGRVLPIGGVKEKVLAAHRLGFKRVVLPKANARDLSEVPETARRELEVVFAETLDDVLAAALETKPVKLVSGAALEAMTIPAGAMPLVRS